MVSSLKPTDVRAKAEVLRARIQVNALRDITLVIAAGDVSRLPEICVAILKQLDEG